MAEFLILDILVSAMELILCSVKSGEMEEQSSQKWNASQIDKALVPRNVSLELESGAYCLLCSVVFSLYMYL